MWEKNPNYTFIRTSVNNWKRQIEKEQNNNNSTVQRRQGRPNLVAEEFLVKVKEVATGVRMVGGGISRKMVIAIGTGVIKALFSSKLKGLGGYIILTEGWDSVVLKSMEWFKRKSTTSKIEPREQSLLEEKLFVDYSKTRHTEATYF